MIPKINERKKIVGTKQAKKAVVNDEVDVVFIAKDADGYIIDSLIMLCQEKNVEIYYVDTMKELGKACGIDVRAASAALLK
ncbi:MAG: 50S ribosomal protein L7ae-like protein [Firmicutes bacterium]|nr:50S ribosomal protein L7ae-like protein [Bacillota bacterium]